MTFLFFYIILIFVWHTFPLFLFHSFSASVQLYITILSHYYTVSFFIEMYSEKKEERKRETDKKEKNFS